MDSVPRSTFEESLDIIETLLDEFDVKPRGQRKEVGEENFEQITEFLQEHRPASVYAEQEQQSE